MAISAQPETGLRNPSGQEAIKVEPEFLDAGPERIARVSINHIIVLPQVRKDMDMEPLDELKTTIGRYDDDGKLTGLRLFHPITINELDHDEAAEYVNNMNTFWGTDLHFDTMEPDPTTGRYNFLVMGHRRLRAITELAVENEVGVQHVRVSASLHHNMPFEEALQAQLQENTYDAPDPTDVAEAVRAFYDFVKLQYPKLTQEQCAKMLGFTRERVSRGLAYSELPDVIKSWVKKKDMSFNLAVTLGRIQEEYRRRYDRMQKEGLLSADDRFEDAEDYAAYEIETFAYSVYAVLQRSRRMAGKAMERAFGQLNTMREQRRLRNQLAFDFMLEVQSARSRRRRSVADLGHFAFRGVIAAVREDPSVLADALAENPDAANMLEVALRNHRAKFGHAEPMFQ